MNLSSKLDLHGDFFQIGSAVSFAYRLIVDFVNGWQIILGGWSNVHVVELNHKGKLANYLKILPFQE